jgi:hypothetical protein
MRFLPQFIPKFIEKGTSIFPANNEVLILVAGNIIVYDHRKKFNWPDIVAYYNEGDIIGADDKDNHLSLKPDIWFVTATNVEYISVNKNVFNELWKSHNFFLDKMKILNFIKDLPIFQGVSELTLYKLAFELLNKQNFTKGDVIFNDGECMQKYYYIELRKQDSK